MEIDSERERCGVELVAVISTKQTSGVETSADGPN